MVYLLLHDILLEFLFWFHLFYFNFKFDYPIQIQKTLAQILLLHYNSQILFINYSFYFTKFLFLISWKEFKSFLHYFVYDLIGYWVKSASNFLQPLIYFQILILTYFFNFMANQASQIIFSQFFINWDLHFIFIILIFLNFSNFSTLHFLFIIIIPTLQMKYAFLLNFFYSIIFIIINFNFHLISFSFPNHLLLL